MRSTPAILLLTLLFACVGELPPGGSLPDGQGQDLPPEVGPAVASTPGPVSAELAASLAMQLESSRVAQGADGLVATIASPLGTWTGTAGQMPAGAGTILGIGSVTKTYVAVATLRLVAEGRLTLDDRLANWLPDLPGADRITVRMLLNHTSGLEDELADRNADFTQPTTRTTRFDYVKQVGLKFEPGSKWEYSNTNYQALGIIIEEITGEEIHVVLRRMILTPAGLTSTSFDGEETPVSPVVRGTWVEEDGQRFPANPPEHPSWAWASGAIVSTSADQARFAEALLTGMLLAPAQLAEMKVGMETGFGTLYGLGLESASTPDGNIYFHGGLVNGTSTFVGGVPSLGLYVAVIATTSNCYSGAVADALLGTVLGAGAGAR